MNQELITRAIRMLPQKKSVADVARALDLLDLSDGNYSTAYQKLLLALRQRGFRFRRGRRRGTKMSFRERYLHWRRRFDVKHYPDAWMDFVTDAAQLHNEELVEKYELKGRSREWIRTLYFWLSGGRRKPRVKRFLRSDITVEDVAILANYGWSRYKIGKELGTSEATVERRLNEGKIRIPDFKKKTSGTGQASNGIVAIERGPKWT